VSFKLSRKLISFSLFLAANCLCLFLEKYFENISSFVKFIQTFNNGITGCDQKFLFNEFPEPHWLCFELGMGADNA
jgi:hypothetical protein